MAGHAFREFNANCAHAMYVVNRDNQSELVPSELSLFLW